MNQNVITEEYYTISEAASKLRQCVDAVYRRIISGEIRAMYFCETDAKYYYCFPDDIRLLFLGKKNYLNIHIPKPRKGLTALRNSLDALERAQEYDKKIKEEGLFPVEGRNAEFRMWRGATGRELQDAVRFNRYKKTSKKEIVVSKSEIDLFFDQNRKAPIKIKRKTLKKEKQKREQGMRVLLEEIFAERLSKNLSVSNIEIWKLLKKKDKFSLIKEVTAWSSSGPKIIWISDNGIEQSMTKSRFQTVMSEIRRKPSN